MRLSRLTRSPFGSARTCRPESVNRDVAVGLRDAERGEEPEAVLRRSGRRASRCGSTTCRSSSPSRMNCRRSSGTLSFCSAAVREEVALARRRTGCRLPWESSPSARRRAPSPPTATRRRTRALPAPRSLTPVPLRLAAGAGQVLADAHAVEVDALVGRRRAVHRHRADESLAVEVDAGHEAGAALHRPRRRQHVEHLPVDDELILRALQVDDRRRARDGDRLFERADLEVGVHRRGERALQDDAFAPNGLEAGQREGDGVGAGPQADDREAARAVGDARCARARSAHRLPLRPSRRAGPRRTCPAPGRRCSRLPAPPRRERGRTVPPTPTPRPTRLDAWMPPH